MVVGIGIEPTTQGFIGAALQMQTPALPTELPDLFYYNTFIPSL